MYFRGVAAVNSFATILEPREEGTVCRLHMQQSAEKRSLIDGARAYR
jgi:hypothetical protein